VANWSVLIFAILNLANVLREKIPAYSEGFYIDPCDTSFIQILCQCWSSYKYEYVPGFWCELICGTANFHLSQWTQFVANFITWSGVYRE
jgi:hypothetical protein